MARGEADGGPVPAARVSRGAAAALLLIGLVAGTSIALAPVARKANALGDRCGLGETAETATWELPQVVRRIAAGGTLTIVALGSSSTFGSGATRPENAYPSRLAALLAHRFPKIRLRVLNRGVGGEEAAAMATRIGRDVLAEHPDLVIWQVGTNGVLHDIDPEAIGQAVREGIARIKATGADVMLMDLQYAPAVLRHERYREMLRSLDAIAYDAGVPLFPRFAIMRRWVEEGRMPLSLMLARDRLHMADTSYDCLARLLAARIGTAAEAPPTQSVTPAGPGLKA